MQTLRSDLSVAIPAYQAEASILAALSSVENQTGRPREVIVIDDGSTDRTVELIAQHHPAVRVVAIPHGGEAAARNAALRSATTEWVAFLDADDRFLPDRLLAIDDFLDANTDVDLVTTDAFMEVNGEIQGLCYGPAYEFASDDHRSEILRRNFVFGHVAVRRRRLIELGGFDETITHTADWAMWMDLILAGGRVGFIDRPLSVYRVHTRSASANQPAMIAGSLQTLRRAVGRADLPAGGPSVLADTIEAYERELHTAALGAALETGHGVRTAAQVVLDSTAHTLVERCKARLALTAPSVARRLLVAARRGRTLGTAGWLITAPATERAADHDPPLTTVVLPFLNEIRFLAGAIDTVRDQTLSSWELLLIDDGSTDGSGEIADLAASRYPSKMRVLRHPGGRNEGLAASRNLGLANARAATIAMLDADDRWEPDKLEQQLLRLAEHPAAGMVTGPTRHHHVDGSRSDEVHPVGGLQAGILRRGAFARALAREQIPYPPPPASVLYRTDALRGVGGVPAGNSTYEDQRTYVAVSLASPTLITHDVLTTYARRADSIYGSLGDDNVVKSQQRRQFEWWLLRTCSKRMFRQPRAVTVAASLVTHRFRVAIQRRVASRSTS